jgi:serine/threonine-protein kinase
LRFSFPQLSDAAAGLGYLSMHTDFDGILRTEPLAVAYSGQMLPSMSLALAAKSLNIPMGDLRINLGTDIELGAMNILTDSRLRIYPRFYGDKSGKSFASYSFYDVQSGRIPLGTFDNKIVLIGMTATAASNTYPTPVSAQMTDVEFNAHVLQSILKEGYFTRPVWAGKVELAMLLLIGLYLSFLLPRLKTVIAAAATFSLLVILLGSSFMLLSSMALWLQTVSAACLLLLGHLICSSLQFTTGRGSHKKVAADSNKTNKMLGFSFQSQGMLDMAFEKFRACPANDEILSMLYNLALDFERKRHIDKAISVYEYMAEHDTNYKDIQARLENFRNLDDAADSSGSSGSGLSSLLLTSDSRPTLGRYEILKELGKGAMGTVYLGIDPKINRKVAIKTMALSQEFEPDELEEVKERFFHEAEIAGMLNHQNIVTIFDVGDEHDLAYIAMEFLDGIDLSAYARQGKLLPPATVLRIIIKVAGALKYAHKHGVIHRDIKPANIMILRNKTVTVTDFGIAHITAHSKTKTGSVMGTPSYMSPEQLSGKVLDGRSDLFSLGVTLYELLSGVRPFRGDSISKLMYKIAKEPHPDIREKCPNLPESICSLIDRMLSKQAADRITSSDEVIEGIMQGLNDLQNRVDG